MERLGYFTAFSARIARQLLSACAGLAGHKPSAGFPLDSVARQYSYWHDAGAFGGGQVRGL